jgi:PTS system nitrogen regulatory IIA component
MSENFSQGLEPLHLDAYDDSFFENLMKIDEVAELLRVSDKTIRRLAIRGELPTTRIGKSYRFIRSDIVRWAKSGGTNEHRR